jgi:hypothetical protein
VEVIAAKRAAIVKRPRSARWWLAAAILAGCSAPPREVDVAARPFLDPPVVPGTEVNGAAARADGGAYAITTARSEPLADRDLLIEPAEIRLDVGAAAPALEGERAAIFADRVARAASDRAARYGRVVASERERTARLRVAVLASEDARLVVARAAEPWPRLVTLDAFGELDEGERRFFRDACLAIEVSDAASGKRLAAIVIAGFATLGADPVDFAAVELAAIEQMAVAFGWLFEEDGAVEGGLPKGTDRAESPESPEHQVSAALREETVR